MLPPMKPERFIKKITTLFAANYSSTGVYLFISFIQDFFFTSLLFFIPFETLDKTPKDVRGNTDNLIIRKTVSSQNLVEGPRNDP